MRDKFITAYFMRVDRKTGLPYKGYLGTIENTLAAKQKYVNFGKDGGCIQVVHLDDEIDIICHDEGKILRFPNNRAWVDDDGKVLDLFAGNILAVRHTGDEFSSILESDVPNIEKYLHPVVLLGSGMIIRIPDDELPEYSEG